MDEFVRSLSIVQAGLATGDFEARVRKRILNAVQDELELEYLLRVSKPKA